MASDAADFLEHRDAGESIEHRIERLRQACLRAGFKAHTVFSTSAEEVISLALEQRIAATELLNVSAALIEHLNALERELIGVYESDLH